MIRFSNSPFRTFPKLGNATLAVVALAALSASSPSIAQPVADEDRVVVVDTKKNVWVSGARFNDRAYLGVRLEEETELEEGGARVTSVVEGSPADEAGLKKGDVIVSFDGRTIRGPVAMTESIHGRESGDQISLTVMRDGRRQTLTVEMGDWSSSFASQVNVLELAAIPELLHERLEGLDERLKGFLSCGEGEDDCDFAPSFNFEPCEGDECGGLYFFGRPVLGVQLVEVTRELREHLGSSEDVGVLVSKVVDGSAAEDAGIEVGDLIVSVAGDEISDTRDLRRSLHDKRGESFLIEVIRDGRSVDIDVTIPEAKREGRTGPRAQLLQPRALPSVVIAPRIRVRRVSPPRPPRPVRPAPVVVSTALQSV